MAETCQEVELDELQTFVNHKGNHVFVWLALCRTTRRILTFEVGLRRTTEARRLWDQLPPPVRQQAHFYSDRLAAYAQVLPKDRHHCRGKVTNHIERFNLTLRQRLAPLRRRTLAFAKSLDHLRQHLAFFLNHYNATLI